MSDYDPTADYETGGETIIDVDTSDAVEPSVVEDGEYKIRITGFNKDNGKIIRIDKNGGKYFLTVFDIPNEPASKSFSKFFSIPDESQMDKKKLNSSKWDLELFKRAFGLSEINFSTMVGAEGWAMLGTQVDEQYGDKNYVKKFITGPDEGAF
jgi:hypothetical protein